MVIQVDHKEEQRLVNKYKLERNLGQELDTVQTGMLDELKGKEVSLLSGGCALNTCRVLRWLDQKDKELDIKFFGSVGNDDKKAILEDIIRKDGIDPR